MTVFLFLVALFLAWPTAGISLLVYFGWIAVLAYLRADARNRTIQQEAAKRLLKSGKGHRPSWANNSDHVEAFLATAISGAVSKGVPRSFISALANEQKTALANYIGLVEDQGASNRQQLVAAIKFICEMWAHAQIASTASEGLSDDIPF
jgi:hypothetical protein